MIWLYLLGGVAALLSAYVYGCWVGLRRGVVIGQETTVARYAAWY